MIDDGRVERKDSFNTDAEACLSDGNCLARPAVLAGNYHTLKSLQSLLCFGFFDPNMHADRIAGLKTRNVLSQLRFFDTIQSIHFGAPGLELRYLLPAAVRAQ